jgi:GT2 family glycosyltransferase
VVRAQIPQLNVIHSNRANRPFTRPEVRGKFLFVDNQKYWIRGVTYGTFRPLEDGTQFPEPERVKQDFAEISANGMNTVRVYTVPPIWLLDIAQHFRLRIMVGLPWEQHIAFLDDKSRMRKIEASVRESVRACKQHSAILGYSLGNEIPVSIVRWHGKHRIEKFLKRLYQIGKREDPCGLFTYVNFPTTEYLQLPFLDMVCFNVYLESRENLKKYLARLQNMADERPLLMAEIGLDSRSNGEAAQAQSLDWQVRTTFESGCAGAIVFAWTDEWHRGGNDIEDWDFGLMTRDRQPKPALEKVRRAFAEVSFQPNLPWPKISVVVCSLNGAKTIRDTLEGLKNLEYPDYEVIVVNDGSTDETPQIAGEYDVLLISTENRGLSNARNTGMEAASGEIVAYIDDDAYPDPHWLKYLARTFMTTSFVGVGGPNIAPPGDGPIADCVANAPGGPTHVLISDEIAEHIPGCNKAFRKEALEAIGGFDARYRAAGDDVDLCWRLQANGGVIGFNPAALVWHHCRNSVKTYWKQQLGYGKAEALLEQKWPEKYNSVGHLQWEGRIYSKRLTQSVSLGKSRIYQGVWGSALFQSLYERVPGTLLSLPLMPEWYLMITFMALLSFIGIWWPPLQVAIPILGVAIVLPIIQAVQSAKRASFPTPTPSRWERFKKYALTAGLHLIQPVARLTGRIRFGLTPWRYRGFSRFILPWNRVVNVWSETWKAPETWLTDLEKSLKDKNTPVFRGDDFNEWDLEIRGGLCGSVRTLMAIEEHGEGKQMIRFRAWPRFCPVATVLIIIFSSLTGWAYLDQAWAAVLLLSAVTGTLVVRLFAECANATASFLHAIKQD